jgi:hypothetical protein
MNITSPDNIKIIAEELDCGFRAFIHRKTGQLLFIPDTNSYSDLDTDVWNEEIETLENNIAEYYEIKKWTSNETFEIMRAFTDQLTDHTLKRQLFESLQKRKPFREFRYVIDDSDDFREQWFDFKNKWQQDYVARYLNQLKPSDE